MSLFIYHERQPSTSALCGVHCLNGLLQRPAFTEIDLAKIAHDLDDEERQLMASGGETKEYYKFLLEDSVNVGDDGNFSIQVLQAALRKRNLECVPLTATNYYSVVVNLNQENAFICNRGSHWFSIRKILPGEWYNFDSLLDEPKHMPESHLASFLDDLFDKDVAIYSVKGNLPSISPSNRASSSSGRWIAATGSNREEFELKYTIELSKSTANVTPAPSSSPEVEFHYPKLPELKEEKIEYPTLQPVQDEVPLRTRPAVVLPKVDTKNLSVSDHLRLMSNYFEKCLNTMEKLDERMSSLEQTFAKIQYQQQKQKM